MEELIEIMRDNKKEHVSTFLDNLFCKVLNTDVKNTASITSEIIDQQFMQDINNVQPDIRFEFGESLRNIRCCLSESESSRQHEIYVKYLAPQKLVVTSVTLPHSTLQDREYVSIEEVTYTFRNYINSLANYFYELESIDSNFTIMEPVKPSFKDDFRRIYLDERTWLHLEVTQDGMATNIHLIGQSEAWQDKLQKGLLKWDHDKSIVENITSIFDIANTSLTAKNLTVEQEKLMIEDEIICGICFCVELPDIPGVPQPLCQNSNCGVFFHKYCLFQWLVTCDGGRPPAFGVANGSCPTCLRPIACSEKNS